MNKKNQKRSYVAPELTETIYFVPENGFANSEVKTNSPYKWESGNEDWWNY